MRLKSCTRCQAFFKANRRQIRCDPCRKVYGRDPHMVVKARAVRAVRYAILTGKLVRQPCERCGKTPAHGHHDDYSKPLEVRWLCPLHHKWLHCEQRAERHRTALAAERQAA